MNSSALQRFRAPAMAQPQLTRDMFEIRRESPGRAAVRAPPNTPDDCLGGLYELQHSLGRSVDERLSSQALLQVVRQQGRRVGRGALRRRLGAATTAGLFERAACRRRTVFAGYADIGLSPCHEMRLDR